MRFRKTETVEAETELPPLALFSAPRRCQEWTSEDVSRWAAEMAVASARRGPESVPLVDQAFDVMPEGKTKESTYKKACDKGWWRRRGMKQLRIVQELDQMSCRRVGAGAQSQYSSKLAVDHLKHSQAAGEQFLKNSVLYCHDTGNTISLQDVATTPQMRAAKAYSVLKSIEKMGVAAGMKAAMLTITAPSEWHANPKSRRRDHKWNGKTPLECHQHLSACWERLRACLAKKGIKLAGVRVEEPQKDGTPHFHIAFFYRKEDEDTILREILRQYPAGLRRRESVGKRPGKLIFDEIQWASLADFDADKRQHTSCGAQCQFDVIATKSGAGSSDGVASFASYVLKYVRKTLGLPADKTEEADDDQNSIIESGPAEHVHAHRHVFCIRSVNFFGLPRGALTNWDLLRQVKLAPTNHEDLTFVPPPPLIAGLAAICQQEKGAGMTEYLQTLGGLVCCPTVSKFQVKSVTEAAETKYGEPSKKLRGVEVRALDVASGAVVDSEQHILKFGRKEILSKEAAAALAATRKTGCFNDYVEHKPAVLTPLVQLEITVTPSPTTPARVELDADQKSAAEAAIDRNHLVIAAAAAGKTRVLIERADFLFKAGVKQDQIVITTFTKKAAAELKDRLPPHLCGIYVGTMHSLSAEWCGVSDENEGYDELISKATCWGKIAFDSLMFSTTTAARHIKKHIIIDECQDLSADQWSWARAWGKTVFAVGDARQSIYKWRKADRAGLDDFAATAERHELTINYRSATNIVALANALMPDDTPSTSVKSGGVIESVKCPSRENEANELISWAEHAASGTTAVLCRTNLELAFLQGRFLLDSFKTGCESLRKVQIMTVHASKGLEFDSVGLACGLRKQSENDDEAREVLYVSVTRARTNLFVTSVGEPPEILAAALAKF